MLADYYRYISYLDYLIGQVLDALAASPYATNTLVVFAADSGVARGSHGLIGKQNLYEHSVRVPLIVSGPGIPAGAKTDAMCYLFDLLPTLGGWAGVPAPAGSQGLDLTAVLRDPAQRGRPPTRVRLPTRPARLTRRTLEAHPLSPDRANPAFRPSSRPVRNPRPGRAARSGRTRQRAHNPAGQGPARLRR